MLICQSLRRKSPSSRATQTCQLVFGGGYDDDDLMRSEVSPLPRPPQSATFRRLFSCPWFDLPAIRQIAFRKGRSVDVGPFHRRNVRATKRDPDRWTMRYVQPRNLAGGLASKNRRGIAALWKYHLQSDGAYQYCYRPPGGDCHRATPA